MDAKQPWTRERQMNADTGIGMAAKRRKEPKTEKI
jgi:hypothetical protein